MGRGVVEFEPLPAMAVYPLKQIGPEPGSSSLSFFALIPRLLEQRKIIEDTAVCSSYSKMKATV